MPTKGTRSILFVSSYAPLLLAMWLRNPCGSQTLSDASLAAAVLSMAALWLYLRRANDTTPHFVSPSSVVPRNSDLMAYIVTYIIPFTVTGPCDRGDVLSILLLFGVVRYLYVHSNMIYINRYPITVVVLILVFVVWLLTKP